MDDVIVDLLGRALEITPAYAATGKVAAVVAAGSVGRGREDRYSDLELDVYWSVAPTDADRRGVVTAIGAELDTLWPFEPDEGEWAENYSLDGNDIGVSGFQAEWMSHVIDRVIVDADPDLELQMRLSALNEGVVLFGADLVNSWRSRSTIYPDALVASSAAQFLQPGRLGSWHQRYALLARHDSVVLRKLCARPPAIILGVLCGLNRVLVEHHSFKWFAATVDRFSIAPIDLVDRLRLAVESDLHTSVKELDRLLEETLDLVDQHAPNVDTAPMRVEIASIRTSG